MPPPPSHRARSSAGDAPARASDDASSSPRSPSPASTPGTPTRRRVVSQGSEFDPGGEFLPDLPLPEDEDADFSSETAGRETPPALRDPLAGDADEQVKRPRRDLRGSSGEGGGLYASVPHLRASESASGPSSNSIFSNGPRSTPYDAAIPFHSPPRPSSPETPSSPTSPVRSGPPSSGPPSYDGRESTTEVSHAAGSRAEKNSTGARAETPRQKKDKSALVGARSSGASGPLGDGKDSLRRLFKLPDSEVFVEEYLCALYKKILLQGRMYVFQNHVCFYSNVFGYTKVKTIALEDVTIVNRAYTAQVVFNAIEIVHKGKCEFFTSFIFPDRTYKTITRAWRACSRYSKIFADQKTLSGAHDARDKKSGDEERKRSASAELKSIAPEVRAMLGEELDASVERPGRLATRRATLSDGPADGPESAGSLFESNDGDAVAVAETEKRDIFRDEEEETAERSSSRTDLKREGHMSSSDRVARPFKASTVAVGGGHGRRASAPALRLASSAVLAAAPAGGEELDEPSGPSGPLSADESDEDDDNESFRAVPFVQNSDLSDTLSVPDAASLPPLPPRPADHATLVESCVVECSVSKFFALAWSDAAGEAFSPACAEERKHRELRVTPWRKHRGYGHARDLTFVAPTNASIGPRETHCHQTQSYRVYRTSENENDDVRKDEETARVALVVDTSQVQKDIPYGDYFRVESRWEVKELPPLLLPDGVTKLNERCEVWVGLRIPFQKSTMLRKVIEKSALEESRQSAQGVLALVERRLAEALTSSAAQRDERSQSVSSPATRRSGPKHRRQRSFADAVAETVDVSKLLIPEGSREVIWRMLFGSKDASASARDDDHDQNQNSKRAEFHAVGRTPLGSLREADGGRDADAFRQRRAGAQKQKRLLSVVGETSAEDDESSEVEDDSSRSENDATPGARGVDFVATSLVRVAKSSRAVLASLLLRRILTAVLIVWLASNAFEETRGFSNDEASSFSSLMHFFSGVAERLFTSRDSDVADVARWKRRAALLELELQALERRAAFVANEAAHARAALAEAMDRTASLTKKNSAARGGFFSS
mmetsp:Transcript_4690/g.18771  ORF Transcript_4690/g.18771 Transcript_4690/m.18771 type:complete len:1066 (-) Transcript_4690:111-3308(-)